MANIVHSENCDFSVRDRIDIIISIKKIDNKGFLIGIGMSLSNDCLFVVFTVIFGKNPINFLM